MLNEKEKISLKNLLREKIERFTDEVYSEEYHNLGHASEELETYMTEAAFSVFMAQVDLNNYLKSQDLLK